MNAQMELLLICIHKVCICNRQSKSISFEIAFSKKEKNSSG